MSKRVRQSIRLNSSLSSVGFSQLGTDDIQGSPGSIYLPSAPVAHQTAAQELGILAHHVDQRSILDSLIQSSGFGNCYHCSVGIATAAHQGAKRDHVAHEVSEMRPTREQHYLNYQQVGWRKYCHRLQARKLQGGGTSNDRYLSEIESAYTVEVMFIYSLAFSLHTSMGYTHLVDIGDCLCNLLGEMPIASWWIESIGQVFSECLKDQTQMVAIRSIDMKLV